MNLLSNLDLTTPAMIFPAISLLMLAYTNRFVVLAELIRDLYDTHQKNPRQENLDQISNLQYRMSVIKKMQICGALSFITAALSMLLIMLELQTVGIIVFALSIVLLIISLLYLLRELTVSIDALTIQLKTLEDKNQKK